MKLKIASYNLWFHKAYPEISNLAKSQNLDILCLQEVFTDEVKQKAGHLTLAETHSYREGPISIRPKPSHLPEDKLKSGKIGLAMYYDSSVLELTKITNYKFPLPWQERKGGRNMQAAHFKHKKTNNTFLFCNIHLSALLSTNKVRIAQTKKAMEFIQKDTELITEVVIAGDFNFPINGSSLRKLMSKYEMQECGTHNKSRTHTIKLLKDKFDRVFISKKLSEIDYDILPFDSSDHAPVICELELE